LRQAGLHDTSLRHSGLPHDAGSRNCRRSERSPGNAGRDEACVRCRSHYDLHRPDLRELTQTIGTDDFFRHLRPSSIHAGLDAAARAAIESDLQLDDSAEHNWLFREHKVGSSIGYPGLNRLGSATYFRVSPGAGG